MSLAEIEVAETAFNSSKGGTVCQVVHNLSVGGAELLAVGIARALRDEFRFVFICLDDRGPLADELINEEFSVYALGRKQGIDWHCSRALRDVVTRERATLIHAHQYTPFFYAALSRLPRFTAPILFTEHGRWFPDHRSWKRATANRFLLRREDRLVGVGQSVRRALIANEGFTADRVGVIYNGVEPTTTPDDREPARRGLQLAEKDFVALQVARLDALKDHATALRAWRSVVDQNAAAKLLLAGDGPQRGLVETLIAELRLRDNVRLLGTRHDVPSLLAASDVALLTSVSEGVPLTILEAMAARRPVVATNVGGVPEVVLHEQTGLLAPAGDDTCLAAQLWRLAHDERLRSRLGNAGRERLDSQFTRERMIADYRTLYRGMCVATKR